MGNQPYVNHLSSILLWNKKLSWKKTSTVKLIQLLVFILLCLKSKSLHLKLFCVNFSSEIWTKLNSFYLRMLCTKLGWNQPKVSREEGLKSMTIYFFILQLPVPIIGECHDPSFEQTWNPSFPRVFYKCQV